MSLSPVYLKSRHFSSLIDKCRIKLKGWTLTLSFSGRIELIKSVMLGIISYWIQSFHFPVSIYNELDRLCANFLWKGQMHAWKWEYICWPKTEGGVGLRRIQDINQAARSKILWNFCTSNSIWANWMKDHYLKGKRIWQIKPNPMNSFVWKNSTVARQVASVHMYQNSSDKWLWLASPNCLFSLTSSWNIARPYAPLFDLAEVIWFPYHNP